MISVINSDNTTLPTLKNSVNNQTIGIQQESSSISPNSSNEQLSSVNSILHKPHSTRIRNGGGVNDYLPGIMKNHMGFSHK